MKTLIISLCLVISLNLYSHEKPVLIVTTDIGQDPDDQQSLVRLLHYADMFRIAGLIANADANSEREPPVIKDSIIHHLIDAYGQIEQNLRVHSAGYPSAGYLHSVVKKGCAGNGTKVPVENYTGKGKDTEGSDWIIKVVDNSDENVHISVFGGACDLAQALWKVSETRPVKELNEFVSKLRVYFIGKQDSSNDWIIKNFPGLWIILGLHHGGDNWQSTYRGVFLGGDMTLTSLEWLEKNITGENPLASCYPLKTYTGKNPYGAMKEGDTPSFLFFLQNGINNACKPEWGGWGGRYEPESPHFFRDAPDSVMDEGKKISSTLATVYRWRKDFQNDFAARVQWGATAVYKNANHYPVISLRGFSNEGYIRFGCTPGKVVSLDASLSFDPDSDELAYEWFFYPEAGSYRYTGSINLSSTGKPETSFRIPGNAGGKIIHLVLKVSDNNNHPLCAYKRIVFFVK